MFICDHHPKNYLFGFRFNIEKKLKLAKWKEQTQQRKRKRYEDDEGYPCDFVSSMRDLEVHLVSQKSAERRKNMTSNRKHNKKMSALDQLKEKREETTYAQGTRGREGLGDIVDMNYANK